MSRMTVPIIYRFENKRALVVGGGEVGIRRAKKLKDYGCEVTLITPHYRDEHRDFKVIEKYYERSDLSGFDIVVAATDDTTLNDQIVIDALETKVSLINSVTASMSSNFSFPAVLKEDDLVISISTSGTAPAFTKVLRKRIRKIIDKDLVEHFKLMKEARILIKSGSNDSKMLKALGNYSKSELRELIEKLT